MAKINDRIVAGIVAGLTANLLKQAIEWTAYYLDITQEVGSDKAAGFLLPKNKIKTKMGRVIGIASDSTIAAGLGIFSAYFFTFTGSDHPVIKGLSIGNATWSAVYGIMTRMGVSSSVYRDPKTVAVAWLAHSVFGITKALVLKGISDPSLFGKPEWLKPETREITNTSAVPSNV